MKVIIDYQIRYKKNISNVIYIFELVKFWGENANFKCDNQGVRYLSEWMSLIWQKKNTGKTSTFIPNSLGWDTVTTYDQSGATHSLTEKNKTNIKKNNKTTKLVDNILKTGSYNITEEILHRTQ